MGAVVLAAYAGTGRIGGARTRETILATILMPLPSRDFDPSETGVPWRVLSGLGHRLVFATPDGAAGVADGEFDALLLPGGHARGMRPYLESALLQRAVAAFFAAGKPVGAICHGVVLAARSTVASGRSVLHGRKTTALLRGQELLAWNLTRFYLGDYYRTYKVTVEDEVTAALAGPKDFLRGPMSVRRDTPDRPDGFAVIEATMSRLGGRVTQTALRGRSPICFEAARSKIFRLGSVAELAPESIVECCDVAV